MRHNQLLVHLSSGSVLWRRSVLIMVLLVAAIFMVTPSALMSQSHRATVKSEKKHDEKKREVKAAKENKKEGDVAKTETEKKDVVPEENDQNAQNKVPAEKRSSNERDVANKEGLLKHEYSDQDFRPHFEEGSIWWDLFKAIVILGLIVGGFYYFFKYITKKTGIQMIRSEAVKVLSVTPLGQNKYIQVVDLAGKLLVLGITDNAINVLSEIHEKDEIDRIRLLSSKVSVAKAGSFQEFLTEQIGRVVGKFSSFRERRAKHSGPTVTEVGAEEVDLSYLRSQKKRLRDLNGTKDENE